MMGEPRDPLDGRLRSPRARLTIIVTATVLAWVPVVFLGWLANNYTDISWSGVAAGAAVSSVGFLVGRRSGIADGYAEGIADQGADRGE